VGVKVLVGVLVGPLAVGVLVGPLAEVMVYAFDFWTALVRLVHPMLDVCAATTML
jgi:hypothetical protein